MSKELTILCVGNYLMGDEGVAIHLAKNLMNENLPEGITVVDGGSGGFKLMEYFRKNESLIIIDATLDNKAPGNIQLIEPHFASDFPKAMSTHEIGLKDLVESVILMGQLPKIYLFIVSINAIQPMSTSLSKEVEKTLFELKDRVIKVAIELATTVEA